MTNALSLFAFVMCAAIIPAVPNHWGVAGDTAVAERHDDGLTGGKRYYRILGRTSVDVLKSGGVSSLFLCHFPVLFTLGVSNCVLLVA